MFGVLFCAWFLNMVLCPGVLGVRCLGSVLLCLVLGSDVVLCSSFRRADDISCIMMYHDDIA